MEKWTNLYVLDFACIQKLSIDCLDTIYCIDDKSS